MQQRIHAIHLILAGRLPNKSIPAATRLSRNTIGRYRSLAEAKGLTPQDVHGLDPERVLAMFNKPRSGGLRRRQPDFKAVHERITTQRFVTINRVWGEYRDQDPATGLQYSHFAARYRKFVARLDTCARQHHVPGDCLMVDFSGDTPMLTNPVTGELEKVQLFVAVDPATGMTFAYAVASQSSSDWILANQKMLEFYGGVPRCIVTDNLKAAVSKVASRGVPAELQKQFDAFAQHVGTAILAARAYHARDKGAVEGCVHLVQERILPDLDRLTFHTLDELNAALAPLVRKLNDQPMQHYIASRRERWETFGKRAFSALPAVPYEYVEWSSAQKVPRNCHVRAAKVFYSVPHTLCTESVDVRLTQGFVDIYHKHQRVARHARSHQVGAYITHPDHLTDAVRAQSERNPDGYRRWAKTVGPAVVQAVECWLGSGPSFAGIPACDALRNLAHRHGGDAIERACRQALLAPKPSVTNVRRLLAVDLEKRQRSAAALPPRNRNARGAQSYTGGPPA